MATEQINQQLEDAANDYITGEEKQSFALTPILRVVKHAFKAGAEWQKDQSLKEFYDHGYIEARVNAEWTDTDMVDFLHTYSIRDLNNCKDVLELYKKLKSK